MYMTKQDHKRIQKEIVTSLRERGIGSRHQQLLNDDSEDNEAEVLDLYHEDSDDDQLNENDDFTMRGLECFTEAYRAEKLVRTKRAIHAILQRQRMVGTRIEDEKWLDSIYRPFCIEAATLARNNGIHDEHAIPSPSPRNVVMVR